MSERAQLLHAFLRTDFLDFIEKCFETLEPGIAFQENWHLAAMAESLRKVRSGETKRLIINVPPRSGKSIVTTIAYTAWVLGHDPHRRIICVSYTRIRWPRRTRLPSVRSSRARGTGRCFRPFEFSAVAIERW